MILLLVLQQIVPIQKEVNILQALGRPAQQVVLKHHVPITQPLMQVNSGMMLTGRQVQQAVP